MKRISGIFGKCTKLVLISAGLVASSFLIVSGAAHGTQGQNSATVGSEYKYEVSSIKPSKPGNDVFMNLTMGDTYTATSVTVQALIESAYGIHSDQIFGVSKWVSSETYDIQAKMESSLADALKKLRPEDGRLARQQMLRALLTDRFKLTFHYETKELPVYSLLIAKNGSKLRESVPGQNPSIGAPSAGGGGATVSMSGAGATDGTGAPAGTRSLLGHEATIERLARAISVALDCRVLDKTGLAGKYDYSLQWVQDDLRPEAEPSGPSIFAAIQEQLGLKLESGKGPVEVLVIDHVERPSGN